MSDYSSTGDGTPGVNLSSHITGDPFGVEVKGNVTIGHTYVIIIGALALLWLLGAGLFRGIRM